MVHGLAMAAVQHNRNGPALRQRAGHHFHKALNAKLVCHFVLRFLVGFSVSPVECERVPGWKPNERSHTLRRNRRNYLLISMLGFLPCFEVCFVGNGYGVTPGKAGESLD
jgi:hypothetical protein